MLGAYRSKAISVPNVQRRLCARLHVSTNGSGNREGDHDFLAKPSLRRGFCVILDMDRTALLLARVVFPCAILLEWQDVKKFELRVSVMLGK
jgi:hypothetical protein